MLVECSVGHKGRIQFLHGVKFCQTFTVSTVKSVHCYSRDNVVRYLVPMYIHENGTNHDLNGEDEEWLVCPCFERNTFFTRVDEVGKRMSTPKIKKVHIYGT